MCPFFTRTLSYPHADSLIEQTVARTFHDFRNSNYLVARDTWRQFKTNWTGQIDQPIYVQLTLRMNELGKRRTELPSQDSDQSERLWALNIRGLHPAFSAKIIRCLDNGRFPLAQRGHPDWVRDWYLFDCEEDEEEDEPLPWEKGCPRVPLADTNTPTVTLSFTVTHSEWWKVALHVPLIICNSLYPFTKVIVYVDGGPNVTPSEDPLPAHTQLAIELNKLLVGGWIHEIRLVERNTLLAQQILRNVFESQTTIETHVKGPRGFLSFAQELEECDTQYCVHFDIGMCAFSLSFLFLYLSSPFPFPVLFSFLFFSFLSCFQFIIAIRYRIVFACRK